MERRRKGREDVVFLVVSGKSFTSQIHRYSLFTYESWSATSCRLLPRVKFELMFIQMKATGASRGAMRNTECGLSKFNPDAY